MQHINGPGRTGRNNRKNSVASSWAHQSDLLRRLPSPGNRSRTFFDSIIRIWTRVQSQYAFCTSANSSRSSGSTTHQEVLDYLPSWFLHMRPATREAAAAFFEFSFSIFLLLFHFFFIDSIIVYFMMLATSSSLSLTPFTFLAGRL